MIMCNSHSNNILAILLLCNITVLWPIHQRIWQKASNMPPTCLILELSTNSLLISRSLLPGHTWSGPERFLVDPKSSGQQSHSIYKVRGLQSVSWYALISQVLLDDGNRIIIPQGNFKVLLFQTWAKNKTYFHRKFYYPTIRLPRW